jgi:signal peptidase I
MFGPRYLKHAKQLIKDASSHLHRRHDLLSDETIADVEEGIAKLKAAMAVKDKAAVEKAAESLDKRFEHVLPPQNTLRDWTETIVASIVVVVAFRAYFLQPFQIPTGSMQPSLNGLIVHRVDGEIPTGPRRWAEELLGRTYVDVVATQDDKVAALRVERTYSRFGMSERTIIIWASGRTETVGIPPGKLQAYGDGFGVQVGNSYKRGEIVARGFLAKGDYVFVDKITYHFRKPHRDDVFVFRTEGIPGIGVGQNEAGQPTKGDYYIKRLAGLPGDILRIDAPKLFINNNLAAGFGFERVMLAADGYNGYVNIRNASYLRRPGENFEVPAANYFALGDNSRGSSDSRFWGTVPEENVVGRGLFVYWPPLNGHIGLIR